MFKTKGFSSNNSLKRRAVIVDAPDLPPEECEFFITAAGVADTDKVDIPEQDGLDLQIENLYEEKDTSVDVGDIPLIKIKGIGEGTVEHLNVNDIHTVSELLTADPKELSAKITGASSKTVLDWQKNAKALINS